MEYYNIYNISLESLIYILNIESGIIYVFISQYYIVMILYNPIPAILVKLILYLSTYIP